MIEIPVINTKGEKVGSEKLDPSVFGNRVRVDLLKQAILAYRDAQRLGTVKTKSRGMVDGSTKKLYRQKGTGNARAGNRRTPTRVGGGHAFAKIPRDFSKRMPKQMRRLARNSAVLAKAKAGTAMIVKGLSFDAPKTKTMAGMLEATKAGKSVLLATSGVDQNMVLSGRNIPRLSMKPVWEVNAYDVLRARSVMFTPEAFAALTADPITAGRPTPEK